MTMQNPPHPGGIVKRQCLERLGMQMAYDLWQARGRAGEIEVERFEAA